MSFRVSALVAGAVVLELAAFAPVSAQPQVPVRPRYSQFNSVFRPGQQFVGPGQGFGVNQPGFVGPVVQAPGFVYPGAVYPGGAYPQGVVYGVDPNLAPTGVAATFANYGHWYGGNYGHWYPNGITNGRGVLGYGGGGVYAGSAGFGAPGGMTGRPSGSLMGATLTGAAAVGAIRR